MEDNGAKVLPAPKRRVRTGVTIAYRWKDGKVLACVGSNVTNDVQREARDEFLHEAVRRWSYQGGQGRRGRRAADRCRRHRSPDTR